MREKVVFLSMNMDESGWKYTERVASGIWIFSSRYMLRTHFDFIQKSLNICGTPDLPADVYMYLLLYHIYIHTIDMYARNLNIKLFHLKLSKQSYNIQKFNKITYEIYSNIQTNLWMFELVIYIYLIQNDTTLYLFNINKLKQYGTILVTF